MHRIASVSKVITKLAVEKLIRKSYLSRSSLVFVDIFGKEFNTILNPKAELITVGHLIDHKVGVWPTTTRQVDPMFSRWGYSHKLLIQSVLNDVKIEQDPGEEYVYSNFGYCLLGRVIEKVSGMSYIEYVR
jgi:D-alanyl-D-alanine carboxypeptidase